MQNCQICGLVHTVRLITGYSSCSDSFGFKMYATDPPSTLAQIQNCIQPQLVRFSVALFVLWRPIINFALFYPIHLDKWVGTLVLTCPLQITESDPSLHATGATIASQTRMNVDRAVVRHLNNLKLFFGRTCSSFFQAGITLECMLVPPVYIRRGFVSPITPASALIHIHLHQNLHKLSDSEHVRRPFKPWLISLLVSNFVH